MTLEQVYYPPADIAAKAWVTSPEQYQEMYRKSLEDPQAFWSEIANDFYWKEKWQTPFSSFNFDVRQGPVDIKWFIGAKTNVCYNAVDRHVEAGLGDKVAFLWEGNDPGNQAQLTYKEVQDKVCQLANYLKSLGVQKGDDVTIYLPMICELPIAMLACARIGAIHSVVFAGFSADALAGRVEDCRSRYILTATAVRRGAKAINLKEIVDEAVGICDRQGHKVDHVIVYDHSLASPRSTSAFNPERDHWWQEEVDKMPTTCEVEWMDAEAPLFKLYTSGSTGKPKGLQHTTAGYMVGAATTFKYVFDHKPQSDVFWCTADCGWITGHSYVAYGPMCHAATQVIFEGIPSFPDAGRFWEVVDKYNVTIFYTAPTAIRALHMMGDDFVKRSSRSSLRLLGTVGEPINPEAWRWYYEVVGDSRCPIMDTWWQTETGAHMITPLVGAVPLKAGSATLPFFGVEPAIIDDKGNELHGECEGYLVMKRAWPSQARTIAGDHERYEKTYFEMYKGYYFTGDGARRDRDGYYWILGRVDDVINVSGHRIGTAEVESALVAHHAVAEAAVVPMEHPIKGQALYAYVTLMSGHDYPASEALRKELVATVRKAIGPIATPDVIHWAPGLPKTRSGKIMRRILRKIADKKEEELGDISTLADPSVVKTLITLRGK